MRERSRTQFQNRENLIILLSGIFLALLLRFSLKNFQSIDFRDFLEPWYNFIIQHGGFSALKYDFSNYTPPYLYLLVIDSYLFSGLSKVFAIKLISIFFDFVCAFFTYKIVRLKYPIGKKPILAFLAVLFAPSILLNSSYWGQADIIYTTGLVACIYFLCIKKEILAFLCFGIAFSFKLQVLFLAPFLLCLWLKKFVSWTSFALIPAVYFVAILPAWFIGRPFKDLLLIYAMQGNTYKDLTRNAPNLYQWIPNQFYSIFVPTGLLLTLIVVILISFTIYKSRVQVTKELLIQIALVFALVMPYFLPKMHERYFFTADTISITFGFYFPNYFFVPIIVGMVSLFSYFPFLIGHPIISLKALSLILGVTVAITIYYLTQSLRLGKRQVLTEE